MFNKKYFAIIIAMHFTSLNVLADEQAQNTTVKLIEQLVEQGVLSRDIADELIESSQSKNAGETKLDEEVEPGVIRVPYIPETVKQEIREQIRSGLREDVSRDVIAKGKLERWGVPGVLPTWVNRLKFSGDIRLRGQSDAYPSENASSLYFNYQAINEAGGVNSAGLDATFNTIEDRERLRIRARLGVKAKITQGWDSEMRLATGSFTDPVSTNQTLGNFNRNFRIVLDRAYIKYTSEFKDFMFMGGRMPNPWKSTDLVWDRDLNFDGLAVKYFFNRTDNPLDVDEDRFDPYLTLGAFPLAEENRYADKWLLGIQAGFDKTFSEQSKVSLSLAYYDYQNIEGEVNTAGSSINNHTAPDYMQKGNSVFDISDPLVATNQLYGLATDYNLLNLTFNYDYAGFAPYHIYIVADYVKNVGYEISNDAKASGAIVSNANYAEESQGYQVKLAFGWPNVRQRGNWRAYMRYKEVERDAVLDAFNDSDFHLGGTDAKGYMLGGDYGIDEDVWLSARWISSDVINGEQMGSGPFKINTFQLDLKAKF